MATEAHIFLDEAGDTGWSLALPFTRGGSSRYLVIAACLLPEPVVAKPEQLIRHLHNHRQWSKSAERKWSRMSPTARSAFSASAAKLARDNPAISLRGIVVDKRSVAIHVRHDPHKLYNYMVKRLLLQDMSQHERVQFRPDLRSVPANSGTSLHDYLQTELWFGVGARTRLETRPIDSRHSPQLQFVDMVAGAIHSHFEFGESRHWAQLEPHVPLELLDFEQQTPI